MAARQDRARSRPFVAGMVVNDHEVQPVRRIILGQQRAQAAADIARLVAGRDDDVTLGCRDGIPAAARPPDGAAVHVDGRRAAPTTLRLRAMPMS